MTVIFYLKKRKKNKNVIVHNNISVANEECHQIPCELPYPGPQKTPDWISATAFSISGGEWCKNNTNGERK